jgi:uncharacterized membrane-anchored protein YhcB (DUF1043 family)
MDRSFRFNYIKNKMKTEKEIKSEIEKIQKRLENHKKEFEKEFPDLYKSFATQCNSKIRALEWVLNEP